jgi:hypothetical protein
VYSEKTKLPLQSFPKVITVKGHTPQLKIKCAKTDLPYFLGLHNNCGTPKIQRTRSGNP